MARKETVFRSYGLDFVKVVAIVWIALYHVLDFRYGWKLGGLFGSGNYWEYFSGDGVLSALIKTFISSGVVGVSLFVIASGFSLALSAKRSFLRFGEFMKKRVFRIFPFYWSVLGVLFLIDFYMARRIDFFDYFVHFFAVNNFFPEYVLSISAPFWFIGTLFQLYLIFPLLFRFSKNPILLLTLAAVLKVFADPFLVSIFGGGRFFTEFIIEFSVGIIFANYFLRGWKLSLRSGLLLLFFSTIFFYGFFTLNFYSSNFPVSLIFQFTGISFFILLFFLGEHLFGIFSKSLAYFSKLSFPVFLTHYAVITNFFVRVNFSFPLWMELLASVVIFFFVALVFDKSASFFRNFRGRTKGENNITA